MVSSVLLNTALSVPLSALLSYLMKKRYACARAASVCAFALGICLVGIFTAAGITPMSGLQLRVTLADIQLLPFGGGLSALAVGNVLGNLFLLTPYAFLTSLLFPEHRGLARQLLLGLLLSAVIETLQLFLSMKPDLTDILLNTLGCAVGYGLYRLFHRFYPTLCDKMEVKGTQCILYAYVLSALMLPLSVGVVQMLSYFR